MKKLIIFTLMFLFLFSYVSATTWTRSVDYLKEDVRQVEFKNWFGLGDTQGTMTLSSHELNSKGDIKRLEVGLGNQVVMYYDFSFNELVSNGLGEVEFIDMRTGKNIDKEYKFVYWYEEERTREICILYEETKNITIKGLNESYSEPMCLKYENEIYIFNEWRDYNSKDIPKGDIRIGIEVNNKQGDWIDGIWNIGSKKLDKHAQWTADLNVNLVSYYKLDETSGTTAYDSHGSNNGTNNGATINQTGKINQAYYFDGGSADYITGVPKISYGSFSISAWVTMNTTSGYATIYGQRKANDGDPLMQFRTNSGMLGIEMRNNTGGGYINHYSTTMNMTGGAWHMATITFDSSTQSARIYVNRKSVLNTTYTGGSWDNVDRIQIGAGYVASNYENNWHGKIDEVAIWSRALTSDEVIQLYNSGNFNINLISPINNYETNTNTINFETEIEDNELGVTNVSLVINDSIVQTNSSGLNGTYNFLVEDLEDGYYEWYIEAYDGNENYYISETRDFTIDILAPEIEILSPVTSYDYLYPNQTIDLNVSISDASDHLDSCWYVYNETLNDYNCSENQTFNYIPNQNSLTVYANDTFGNIGSESVSWDYKLLEHSFNYTNELYETENTKYLSKLSYNQSNQVRVILDINGTNHTLLNTGNQTFEKSLDFPLVNSPVNVTSNLYYFYDDVLFNEKEFNQTIHPIIFQLCNATINTITLNYTINDELTESLINSGTNPTTFKAYNEFWLGSGDVKKEYTTNELNKNKNNYTYCISPSNISYKTNMNIEFSAIGYTPRQYSLVNAIINNQTNLIKLFLLNADDSVKFNIDVKKGVSWLQNANIIINKYYLGSNQYIPLSIRTTDSSGKFIEYFEVDSKIRFDISKDNVFLGSIERDALCLTQPCEMTLNIEEVTTNPFYKFNETFAENVVYSLDYNATTKLMTASFLDTSGLANYFRFEVKRVGDELGACNTTVYTTSGSITCDLTNKQGDYIGTLYISRSPEKIVDYIFAKLQGFVDALGKNGLLIALMVIVIVGLIGSWNPAVGVLMMSVAILLMSFLNFVAFPQTTVMLILILAIIIIVRLKS